MLELGCVAIVAVWYALRLLIHEKRRTLLAEALVIMVAAWASEQSAISLYGFYAYADRWWLMLGDVPLTVVLIWPVVVLSARDVINALLWGDRASPSSVRVAAIALAVITFDAAFIEPAAVDAQLWTWSEPGVFGVPIIGIVGWGVFGALMVLALGVRRGAVSRVAAVVVVLPALHIVLLALWWGGFRFVTVSLTDVASASSMVVIGVALGFGIWWVRQSQRVPIAFVLLRAPGALFFVVLMASGAPPTALVVWSVAISVPWSVLALRAWQGRSTTVRP